MVQDGASVLPSAMGVLVLSICVRKLGTLYQVLALVGAFESIMPFTVPRGGSINQNLAHLRFLLFLAQAAINFKAIPDKCCTSGAPLWTGRTARRLRFVV